MCKRLYPRDIDRLFSNSSAGCDGAAVSEDHEPSCGAAGADARGAVEMIAGSDKQLGSGDEMEDLLGGDS